MKKTILITGASTGIGAACAKLAAKMQLNVIATARRRSHLQSLHDAHPNIQPIVADIATETGRNIIAQSINQPINFLLHNAAILDTPQELVNLDLLDFRNNFVTNVEPIIFLTQALIPHFNTSQHNGRILSLSSGAAKQAIAGLGNYCISKAAALMANQVLKVELPKHDILVNDYFPGVVDTNMQHTLRNSQSEIFPFAENFKELKLQGKLSKPQQVAANILEIFTQTDDQLFNQSEWLYQPNSVFG